MKALTLSTFSLFFLAVSACSSLPEEKRTKWSDKNMRLAIDGEWVSAEDLARVTHAMVKADRWIVVDRGPGFKSVTREQNLEHRETADRFENKAKYAQWKKLLGVGAIVIPHVDCRLRENVFSKRRTKICNQFLTLVDSNTAEILISAAYEESTSEFAVPSWDSVVQSLGDEYPKKFIEIEKSKRLMDYEKQSEEIGLREERNNEVDVPK